MSINEFQKLVAINLLTSRKKAGLTQRQVVDLTGLNRETMTRVESGKHMPTLDTIYRLCEVYQIPIYKIFMFD